MTGMSSSSSSWEGGINDDRGLGCAVAGAACPLNSSPMVITGDVTFVEVGMIGRVIDPCWLIFQSVP